MKLEDEGEVKSHLPTREKVKDGELRSRLPTKRGGQRWCGQASLFDKTQETRNKSYSRETRERQETKKGSEMG
jgi:hypothetical protein